VTHDIGETLDFDRVLVIADGKIAEDGNPQELLARKSRYGSLIEAESRVTSGMWGASTWRRWRVAGGRVEEQSVQEARAA
jgi:ATP-binding cassette subfamily B protein